MDKQTSNLFEKLNNEIIKYNPYYNKELIEKAFLFAYKAHDWFFRESKDPYIVHCLETALILTRIEADDISIVCALLHDICDNHEYNIKSIEKFFTKEIAYIVDWVNKLWDLYYKTEMNKSEIDDLKKSLLLVWNDIRIFLIKIADRLHNLQTLEFLSKEKRYRIAKETEEIYIPIINFLSIWEFLTEFHDLCFKYLNEKDYKKLFRIYWKNQKNYEKIIIEANNLIEKEIKKTWIEYKISSRIKSLYSINKKMISKNIDISEIYDILALRIATTNIDDCYKILWIVHKVFKIKNDKFKDYISSPKENWYQSIHTTVFDNNWNLLEVQIETFEMNKLNKSWLAAHFIYKWFWVDYINMPAWMKWVMDIQKKSIDAKCFLEKLNNEIIVTDIKCLSQDGKIIILPKNAVLIDYAFEVWDDFWTFFESATINWIPTNDPFYELKDWDFIKIKIWKEVNFDYKVEKIISVKTQKARDKLKEIFNKHSKAKTQDLWRFLLNSELEIYSYKHFENLPQKIKQLVIKNFWLKDEKQLFLFLWLWILEQKKVFDYIITFFEKKDYKKEISLKIFTKMNDFVTINNITNICYDLNINIRKLFFNQKQNVISLTINIENKEDLDNLLEELKRAPNVLNVLRVFSTRLIIYYILFFSSLIILAWIVLFINLLNVNETRTMLIKSVFYWSIIFMIFLINFLKYIVKRMIPDVLRYKRFWLSIFWLNGIILSIVFWELYRFWFYFDLVLYIIFSIFMVWALIIQYLNFRRTLKHQKNL